MTESTQLAVRRPLTPQTWQMIESVAPAMHKSRLFGVSSPDAAAAIMLKGYELGLGLSASFDLIHVVQGKPTLSPRGALAIIQGHPELAGLKIEDIKDEKGNPQACKVWMKRRNGFEYETSFSMADAERAGVVKKGSAWESYPANMLRWRAVGFCADVVFPDVIGGLKRADELGAEIDEDGDVIEGSWSEPVDVNRAQVVDNGDDVLQALIAQYGAEAVMAANGGAPPASNEEIAAVMTALANAEEEE